jgi:hypothetical protein
MRGEVIYLPKRGRKISLAELGLLKQQHQATEVTTCN